VNIRLLASFLDCNLIWVSHIDRLISIEFELTINYLFRAHLLPSIFNLISLQKTLGNFLEVPSDDIRASRCNNACFIYARVIELIKSGSREVNRPNLEFSKIFNLDTKLSRLWFILTHLLVKSILVLTKAGWDEQEVSLCGGYDPLGIHAHINGTNWITKTWKKSLGILTNF